MLRSQGNVYEAIFQRRYLFYKKSVVLDDKNVIFFEKMSCSYMKPSNQCAVSFLHEQCANCPYQDQCKPKIFKKVAKIVTSKAAHERAKIQRNMNSKEFKNYTRLRNGVETVPSNIRKNYHLEKIPRGKRRGKFFFGSKIAALNFRKLFIEIEDKVIYGFDPNIKTIVV